MLKKLQKYNFFVKIEGKKHKMENIINVHIKIIVQNKKTLEGGAQMEITEVRVRKVNSGNRVKAVAQITFDNEFVVHEIKVIERPEGLFIAMPRRKKNDRYYDIAHPINQQVRDKLTKAVVDKYEEAENPEPTTETVSDSENEAE